MNKRSHEPRPATAPARYATGTGTGTGAGNCKAPAAHTPVSSTGDDARNVQLLRQLAHELRTPIATILTLTDVLRSEQFTAIHNGKSLEYIENIHASAAHALDVMTRTLDEALDQTLSGAAQTEPLREQLDIPQVLAECVVWLAPAASAAGVTLVDDTPTEPSDGQRLTVWTDRMRLRQIILNLMNNALKFTPAGQTVRVGCRATSDGGITITVTDTGIGMSSVETALLNGASGSMSADDGSPAKPRGLGLNLVRSLARECGAELALESARSHGTTATIRFPPERTGPQP